MTETAAVGFTDVLPEHRLAQLVRDGDNAALGAARTDRGGDRRCSVAFLDSWIAPLYEVVQAINAAHFGFDIQGIEPPQYTLYREGDYFAWHMDRGPDTPRPRKLSLTLQLSEASDYDGGELEVYTGAESMSARRERGYTVVFPSFILHRVTPVTQGERRALVVWAFGESFK